MEKVSIIGLDLAKRSFQAHGAVADGGVGFRKKLSREKVLGFFAVALAAVNIFGGFLVTQRMLSMFKKKGK